MLVAGEAGLDGGLWVDVEKNLVVSAITAITLLVARLAWKAYTNRKILKRYPVKGRYITYFDDVHEGTKSVDKAEMVLDQSGYRIHGTTTTADGKREWNMEGEIVGHGLLCGTYLPTSPHDPGRGTFFMEPNLEIPGEYKGIWAGYDSANRQITAGAYRWKKLLDMTIEQFQDKNPWTDSALALLGDSLGQRYIDEQSFREYVTGQSGSVALGAYVKGELAGVLLAKILEKPEAAEYEAIARKAGCNVSLTNHRLGILKSIAVKSSLRKQGIGTMLSREAVKHMKNAGCTAIFAVGWESGSFQSSGVLQTMGFERLVEIKEFWKEDSIKQGYLCPKCGNPCTCTASLYLIKL